MKVAVRALFALAVLASSLSRAWAGSELEPDTTKLVAEDAYTVSPGDVELELTYGYAEATHAFGAGNHVVRRGKSRSHDVAGKATFGLTERLEAAILYSWGDLRDEEETAAAGQGFGDAAILFKWNVLNSEDGQTALAYLPGVTFPTGEATSESELGLGQDCFSFDQLIALTFIKGRAAANLDAGYSLPFGEDRFDYRGQFVADAAAGYQLLRWMQPELELNFAHEVVDYEQDSDVLAVTAGVILNLTGKWRVDAGLQQAVYGRNADRSTAGIVNASYTW